MPKVVCGLGLVLLVVFVADRSKGPAMNSYVPKAATPHVPIYYRADAPDRRSAVKYVLAGGTTHKFLSCRGCHKSMCIFTPSEYLDWRGREYWEPYQTPEPVLAKNLE
jgi:hypothetical protein